MSKKVMVWKDVEEDEVLPEGAVVDSDGIYLTVDKKEGYTTFYVHGIGECYKGDHLLCEIPITDLPIEERLTESEFKILSNILIGKDVFEEKLSDRVKTSLERVETFTNIANKMMRGSKKLEPEIQEAANANISDLIGKEK